MRIYQFLPTKKQHDALILDTSFKGCEVQKKYSINSEVDLYNMHIFRIGSLWVLEALGKSEWKIHVVI